LKRRLQAAERRIGLGIARGAFQSGGASRDFVGCRRRRRALEAVRQLANHHGVRLLLQALMHLREGFAGGSYEEAHQFARKIQVVIGARQQFDFIEQHAFTL
jgi:hypothetical protein